jgi:hypothetical protein
VLSIEKRNALILLTVVAVAAIMSGIVLNAYSTSNGNQDTNGFQMWTNGGMMAGPFGPPNGRPGGRGCYGYVEVSEEFKDNVINIAQSDEDVQTLLNDGYNITGVRPIITTTVEADGTLTTKATSAIVMLEKDTTGHATVWVDIGQGKVTRIVILTRTVIDKS